MRLKIEDNWECFTPIDTELADFSIITGINGVGKSMLLLAIRNSISTPIVAKLVDSSNEMIRGLSFFGMGQIGPTFDLYTQNTSQINNDPLHEIYWYYYRLLHNTNIGNEIVFPEGYTRVAEKLDKDITTLTIEDIYNYYELADGQPNTDLFSHKLGELIGYYAKRKHDNAYNGFENTEEGKSNAYLDKTQFIEHYGKDPLLLIRVVATLIHS